jgi:hypothetical protein
MVFAVGRECKSGKVIAERWKPSTARGEVDVVEAVSGKRQDHRRLGQGREGRAQGRLEDGGGLRAAPGRPRAGQQRGNGLRRPLDFPRRMCQIRKSFP